MNRIPDNDNPAPPVVLGSGSATRAHMLRRAGIDFTVDAAAVDEEEIKNSLRSAGADSSDVAEALAELKAARVSTRHPGALVIGADQILDCDGIWFDKPRDMTAAGRDLAALRGKMHMQVTAVCVVRDNAVLWHHTDRARLTMRDVSDDFLDGYLAAAGEAILGCVGAYRLEDLGAQLFSRIEGDYFTVLGLPLLPLLDFLRGQGVLRT